MEYFYCPVHKERIERYKKHSHDDCFEMVEYYENLKKDIFVKSLFDYWVKKNCKDSDKIVKKNQQKRSAISARYAYRMDD